MPIEFKLPDLGENVEAGEVVNVLVAEGDLVEPEQNVLELETDKAVVELPCPYRGRVLKVHVKPGDRVTVGQVVLTLDGEAPAEEKKAAGGEPRKEEAAPQPAAEARATSAAVEAAPEPAPPPAAPVPPAEAPQTQAVPEPPPASTAASIPRYTQPTTLPPRIPGVDLGEERPRERPPAPAGPATRRLARELGVDLHQVPGTGPGGRITMDDVKAFVRELNRRRASGPVAPPLPDFETWGPVDREPLRGIRRKTAEAMALAWSQVPQVTQFDLADITELEQARRRYDTERREEDGRITVTVLALKAAAIALKAFPRFNASIDPLKEEIILKRYYHIGVAVDTEQGLLVPVVRDADRKSLRDLALELEDLARRARERKLDLEELRGGTFTISNLGGIGGTAFTPIVNYPEVAILGIARARWELVPDARSADTPPARRLVLPLALSYDHRVIDGADGARFLRFLAGCLEDPFRLLVDA